MQRSDNGEVVEDYYGRAADHYAATWDPSGRMHWGYFADHPGDAPVSLTEAIEQWDRRLCKDAGITADSTVLDLGCGTGATAGLLAQETGCSIVGVDLHPGGGRSRATVPLMRGDAMRLPFRDGVFSHVCCQAMLCHVPDRATVLAEIRRVLAPGGIVAIDDVITPVTQVSAVGHTYYYDRVADMGPQLSLADYVALLSRNRLTVLDTADLSEHMRESYRLASEHLAPTQPDTAEIYRGVIRAIDLRDLGWAYFLCRRP
ncbi:class I SAM-dependent methyltransferase [Nocardia amikacinitolerans]|uniref:class I SAM-dependent methyltransferase n=1 Tax=Nocardia amikacinitolerans TaxID=756689 RepID=UPI0020A4112E|nr:class I SAM-dependent methyltransferase [Nocardia amikacinitolerans]